MDSPRRKLFASEVAGGTAKRNPMERSLKFSMLYGCISGSISIYLVPITWKVIDNNYFSIPGNWIFIVWLLLSQIPVFVFLALWNTQFSNEPNVTKFKYSGVLLFMHILMFVIGGYLWLSFGISRTLR